MAASGSRTTGIGQGQPQRGTGWITRSNRQIAVSNICLWQGQVLQPFHALMGCTSSKEVPDLERVTTKEGDIEAFLTEPSEEREGHLPARVGPPDPAPPPPSPLEAKEGQAEAAEIGSTEPPTPAQSRPPPLTETAEDPQSQGQRQGEPAPIPAAVAVGDADEVSPLPMRAEPTLALAGGTEPTPAPGGANVKQVLLLSPYHPSSLCYPAVPLRSSAAHLPPRRSTTVLTITELTSHPNPNLTLTFTLTLTLIITLTP